MEKTREQLLAEQEKDIIRLEQYQHRIQRLENRAKYLSKAERTARAHRLIMIIARRKRKFSPPNGTFGGK